MKTFLTILTALLLLGASPALASEGRGGGGGGGGHPGGGYGGGGGGCGGGCGGGGGHDGGGHGGGGHPGGGYGGNINVNVNANANAYAGASAGAGAYINARGYDVGAIRGQGGYGGVVSMGGGGPVDLGGYGGGHYGAVVVTGPGYGPSRPFGYVAQGFGRRYVTTDRCCGLRPAPCYGCGGQAYPPAPPPPPSPPSYPTPCNCQGGHGHGGYEGGYSHQQGYSGGGSYSSHESYSESSSGYSGGQSSSYQGGDRYSDRRDDGPRYAPTPYHASPLEPVSYAQAPQIDYAPPEVHYSGAASAGAYGAQSYETQSYQSQGYSGQAYAPVEPQVYQPAPVYIQAPGGYSGDLPPGDYGDGYPYRQEPGERG